MSFDWNLSSDEEDLEEWTRKEGFLSEHDDEKKQDTDEAVVTPSPFAAARAKEEESSSEEEDGVDWEDVDEDEVDDRKPPAAPDNLPSDMVAKLRPVNIDLNKKYEKEPKKSRKRKRRNKFRLGSLPGFLQNQLWNLHRSHLLALTSRAVFISERCSDPEVLPIALSLVPMNWSLEEKHPTLSQLRKFAHWYFDLVHRVGERRQQQMRANLAAGAPRERSKRGQEQPTSSLSSTASASTSTEQLIAYMSYLSATNDEDPQIAENFEATDQIKIELLIAMARCLGWRARFVQAMDPMTPDLDVEHPLLAGIGNVFSNVSKKPSAKKRKASKAKSATVEDASFPSPHDDSESSGEKTMGWVEILCQDKTAKSKHRWIHVDPLHKLVNQPDQVEILLTQQTIRSTKRSILAYAVAVEHCLSNDSSGKEVTRLRLTDVTPRYAKSWIASLRKRGVALTKKCSVEESVKKSWWSRTLQEINNFNRTSSLRAKVTPLNSGLSKQDAIVLDDDSDNDKKPAAVERESTNHFDADHEAEELKESAKNEAIPTSKAAFQTHPLYVIPSVLGNAEVLAPDASERVCGVFKGQLVYRRADVSTALTAKKWLYEGRKVLEQELAKPIKRVKARKKPASAGFKALRSYGVGNTNDGSEERRKQDIATATEDLEDGMENLYAKWQTKAWSPAPVGPSDEIPVNEYKNIELALLNPGLVHIDQRGLAAVAKKLGIPYAPCLLGFEGHGGNRTPTVRGIVVHQHNEQLIREAGVEVASHAIQQDHEGRRKAIRLRWKRLMVGLLTKARLDREYGEVES